MATLTLNYNAHSSMSNQMIDTILRTGATIVEPKNERVTDNNEVLKAYQKMFGKRKDNKYSDNEIFVFNSQRSLVQLLEHYED